MTLSDKIAHTPRFFWKIIFFGMMLLGCTQGFAQESKLSRESWLEMRREVDYSTEGKENVEAFRLSRDYGGKDRHQSDEYVFSEREPSSNRIGIPAFLAEIIKYALILAAIAFLVFLIQQALGQLESPNSNKTVADAAIEIKELTHEMPKSDLEKALEKALAEQDFRMAIRVYYLLVIKDLSGQGLIHWRKEKTNFHYLQELTDAKQRQHFRELTYTFEKAWYGQFQFNSQSFGQAQEVFVRFLQMLKNQPAA